MNDKKDKPTNMDEVKKFVDCIAHPKDCKEGNKK